MIGLGSDKKEKESLYIKILTKYCLSRSTCRELDSLYQQQKGYTSITKHFSFILNSSELVSQLGSQLLTSIANDRTRVR